MRALTGAIDTIDRSIISYLLLNNNAVPPVIRCPGFDSQNEHIMALLAAPHRPVAVIGRLSSLLSLTLVRITYASQENNFPNKQIMNSQKENTECKLR